MADLREEIMDGQNQANECLRYVERALEYLNSDVARQAFKDEFDERLGNLLNGEK